MEMKKKSNPLLLFPFAVGTVYLVTALEYRHIYKPLVKEYPDPIVMVGCSVFAVLIGVVIAMLFKKANKKIRKAINNNE